MRAAPVLDSFEEDSVGDTGAFEDYEDGLAGPHHSSGNDGGLIAFQGCHQFIGGEASFDTMYNALARVERCGKIGRDMVKLVVDSDVADLGESLCRALISGFEEDDSL